MSSPKMLKWVVEFEVAEVAVSHGFHLTDEMVKQMIRNEIDWHYDIAARIVESPRKKDIMIAQGLDIQDEDLGK